MNVLSLFDGLGTGRYVFDLLGYKNNIEDFNYCSYEIDKYAISVAKNNYSDNTQLGNILDIENTLTPYIGVNDESKKGIDIMIGGSPCKDFSFVGNKNGLTTTNNIIIDDLDKYLRLKKEGYTFKGESWLFWEYVRILKKYKPKYFLLENVKMSKKWEKVLNHTLFDIKPYSINSSLLTGQNRERLYWLGKYNPEKDIYESVDFDVKVIKDSGITVGDIMDCGYGTHIKTQQMYVETGKENGHVANAEQLKGFDIIKRVYSKDYKCPTLTTSGRPKIMTKKFKSGFPNEWRELSIEEWEMLQQLPVDFTKTGLVGDKEISISNTQRKKMIGNGWTVGIIKILLEQILMDYNSIK
jgi:site-specific DNA-cytosine methylase